MNSPNITIRNSGWLLFPVGGKGGCGKTTFLAHLIILLLKSVCLKIYDFEPGIQTGLSRYVSSAVKAALHERSHLDRLINDFQADASSRTVVDFPANSGPQFLQWVRHVPWKLLRQHGIEVVVIVNATDDTDSLISTLEWVGHLQTKVRYVLVENEKLGSSFDVWRKTREGILFVEEHAPLRIRFPKIPNEWQTRLANQGKTVLSPDEDLFRLLDLHWMDTVRLSEIQTEIAQAFTPLVHSLLKDTPDGKEAN